MLPDYDPRRIQPLSAHVPRGEEHRTCAGAQGVRRRIPRVRAAGHHSHRQRSSLLCSRIDSGSIEIVRLVSEAGHRAREITARQAARQRCARADASHPQANNWRAETE